jgi:hypothetical protein
MLGADGMSLGAASAEVDGADPQPSDDTKGSLWDLVMRGASFGVPRSATPGEAAPAPGSLSAVCPGVFRLLLLGSPGFPPAYRLEASGGQHGVHVFVGHRHREFVA